MVAFKLDLVRTAIFGAATVLSVPLLALGGYACSKLPGYAFPILAIVEGTLIFFSLPALFLAQKMKPNAVFNWVVFQFVWINILWIKVLACAAQAASYSNLYGYSYYYYYSYTGGDATKGVVAAIAAIGFIIWALLLASNILLVTFALKAYNRGNRHIFTQPVARLNTPTEPQGEKSNQKTDDASADVPPVIQAQTYPPQ